MFSDIDVAKAEAAKAKKQTQERRNQRRLWWISTLSWSTLAVAIGGFFMAWGQVSQGGSVKAAVSQQAVGVSSPSSGQTAGTSSGGSQSRGGGDDFFGGSGTSGSSGGSSSFQSGSPSSSSSGLFGGSSGGFAAPIPSGGSLFGSRAS